jgi:uncharacterized C2H2 Zn-finger protein
LFSLKNSKVIKEGLYSLPFFKKKLNIFALLCNAPMLTTVVRFFFLTIHRCHTDTPKNNTPAYCEMCFLHQKKTVRHIATFSSAFFLKKQNLKKLKTKNENLNINTKKKSLRFIKIFI